MGNGLNGILQALQKGAVVSWGALQSLPENKDRYLSVLNGLIGDTLDAYDSQLAIEMELIGEVDSENLCILVHGLCDSEETWQFREDRTQCYGALLKQDIGHTPLYLRYNSGLHISTNGQKLSQLLDQLCRSGPKGREIILIGHSMGGLVVHSACHYGEQAKASWVKKVRKVFLLGAPHLGADLERIGNLTTTILKTIPNPYTKGIAALANKRSAGMKDLRFGYLVDEDWRGQDPDALWRNNRHPVPPLADIEYYVIASILAKDSENIFTEYFGDGMVRFSSAQAAHFPEKQFKRFKGLWHLELARHPDVYRQIRDWCTF